jgi:endo-1,4-beta-xylanase
VRTSAPNITRCLDVPKSKFLPGTRLQLWDCNGSAAQLFSYDVSSQHLTIGGLCVQAGGNGQAGAAVVLGACSGDGKLTWKVGIEQDHAEFTGFNGLCLDLVGGHSNNGTLLQVWACNRTAAQLWDFTRVKAP